MPRPHVLVAILSMLGCSVNEPGTATTWDQFDVGSVELELVDDKNYELLAFGKEGFVSATMGLKEGPLTAPLLYWHIEDGHLYITQRPHSDVLIDLREPRVEGAHLIAKRGIFGRAIYVVRRGST